MKVTLPEVFNIPNMRELNKAVRDGWITTRKHPELPYMIYNYSKQTTYQQHWNNLTETARGVIFNYDTYEVIARPLRKFYNYEESRAHRPNPRSAITAFDKLDGSLGILYPDPSQKFGYAVATRGSFTSDQAKWATAWLNARDQFPWKLREASRKDFTLLVEIIYPDNRIVLDYGSRESLVYLGEVVTETGEFTWFPEDWNGEHAAVIQHGRFEDIGLLEDRENAEGLVVYDWAAKKHVKLKQQDYLDLHKLVSGLNERAVLDALQLGHEHYDEWMRNIPEEFREWAINTSMGLVGEFIQWSLRYTRKLNQLLDDFELDYENLNTVPRRDLAEYINRPESGWDKHEKSALWLDVDKRDNGSVFWKQVELAMKERNKSNE